MMWRCSLLALLTIASAACAAAPSLDLQLSRLAPGEMPFELQSGFTAPTSIVVRDQAEWAALWDTIYANTTPQPPRPDVDFGTHLIIARAMGSRPTGGYGVVLSNLIRQGGEYLVQVRETAPGAGCGVTLALTSPVDVARIARHDDPIKFAISTETRECAP